MIIYLTVFGLTAIAVISWIMWVPVSTRAIRRRASESRAAAIEILRTLDARTK